ncbi:MAG: ABC transporter substrate-binding protein [Chloroflexi bacterium]|nr:ABC transporter substrate-binding protein [Chloroflexota bacterium]
MRIVSLLPSATEIVCALGLRDELVGVTHECDYPANVVGLPVLTRDATNAPGATSREIHRRVADATHGGSSLYVLDEAALEAAEPDLILTQELCSVCAVSYREVNEVARAIDADIQVVSLEPASIEGIFHTISTVGALTGAEDAAVEVLGELRERLAEVERRVAERRASGVGAPRVAAVEWLDPPFAAGHWVPEQVRRAGGWEVLGEAGAPSLETTWSAVADVDPAVLVLMPCGYHLAETVAEWARTERPPEWDDLAAVHAGAVVAVDGSAYFSRPGPRVIDGIELLAEVFDPEAFEGAAPAGSWTPIA